MPYQSVLTHEVIRFPQRRPSASGKFTSFEDALAFVVKTYSDNPTDDCSYHIIDLSKGSLAYTLQIHPASSED